MSQEEKEEVKKGLVSPGLGSVVSIRWIDSGAHRQGSAVSPPDASLVVATTYGKLVYWCDNDPQPQRNFCVLLQSECSEAGNDDLFSIWIQSIISVGVIDKQKKS